MRKSTILQIIQKNKIYFQIAISIIFLLVIFKQIDTKATFSMIFYLDLSMILLLLGISLLKFFTQAINWFFCLKIPSKKNNNLISCSDSKTEYKLSLRDVIKTHLIGLTLRLIIPGGYASFGKVFFINQEKKQTFNSIIIEKSFTLWIIYFFALLALVFISSPKTSFVINDNINFFLLSFPFSLSIILSSIIIILPFLFIFLFKDETFKANYLKTIPKIMTSQIIFEFLTFFQYYILLQFFINMNLSFYEVALCISLILVANTIPITFSGLGLRETASAFLLPKIGIPVEIAVGVSLIIFLFNAILPALPGILLIALYKKNKTNL